MLLAQTDIGAGITVYTRV